MAEAAASAARDGASPPPPASPAESAAVLALSLAYAFVLADGLAVAASGALPAAVGDAAYHALTPSVFSALAASALYGVWKSRQPL